MKNMRLMKTSILTGFILGIASTLAILLIFANMTDSLGSAAFAQGNQSQPQQGQQQNQTGGSQAGGQQQQNQTGGGQAGAAQTPTLGNASQLPQVLGNNTAVLSQNTPVGNENVSTAEKMNKEQTSLGNKTESKNMTQQQGGGSSGQSNATGATGGGATNQSQQQQQGGGNQSQPQQQGQQQATGGGNATNQSQQQGQNNTNPLSNIPVIGKLFGGK
jgi:protein-glutamine gamma-glutamyltransferase